jgi:hypothetical protein
LLEFGIANQKVYVARIKNKLWACHRYEIIKERTIPRPPAKRVADEDTQKKAEVKFITAFFLRPAPVSQILLRQR